MVSFSSCMGWVAESAPCKDESRMIAIIRSHAFSAYLGVKECRRTTRRNRLLLS